LVTGADSDIHRRDIHCRGRKEATMVDPARRTRLLRDLEQDFLPDYDAQNMLSTNARHARSNTSPSALDAWSKPSTRSPPPSKPFSPSCDAQSDGAPSSAVAAERACSAKYESARALSVGLLDRGSFREDIFEGLVRLLGEIDVKLAKLGRPGDEIFKGGFQVFTLYLRRLVESLRAEKPFPNRCAALERLLRVINNFSNYRLGALRSRAERG
jgi:hypothetical protein